MAILKLKTAPTVEPLTRDEAKQHCRIDGSEDDLYVDALITTTRKIIEDLCGPLISQTWEQYEQDFPYGDALRIWKPRVSAFTSLTYTDINSVTTTFAAASYTADIINEYRPSVVLNYNYTWPSVTLHTVNPIKLTFTCGYGTTAASVPKPLIQAMLFLIEHLYDSREMFNISVTGKSVVPIPWTMEALIASYRAWGFEACA